MVLFGPDSEQTKTMTKRSGVDMNVLSEQCNKSQQSWNITRHSSGWIWHNVCSIPWLDFVLEFVVNRLFPWNCEQVVVHSEKASASLLVFNRLVHVSYMRRLLNAGPIFQIWILLFQIVYLMFYCFHEEKIQFVTFHADTLFVAPCHISHDYFLWVSRHDTSRGRDVFEGNLFAELVHERLLVSWIVILYTTISNFPICRELIAHPRFVWGIPNS